MFNVLKHFDSSSLAVTLSFSIHAYYTFILETIFLLLQLQGVYLPIVTTQYL